MRRNCFFCVCNMKIRWIQHLLFGTEVNRLIKCYEKSGVMDILWYDGFVLNNCMDGWMDATVAHR